MANISTWSATAASNNATPPDGFPEGQTPSSVNNSARELMAAIRRQHEDAQWIDLGLTHTRTGSDTFTIVGDYTSTYEVGRRVKMTGSATNYGTISASSYSAPDTTVTISEGNVPASLSAVAISILSTSNSSVPSEINHGPIGFNGGQLRVTASTAHTTGAGLELAYFGGEGVVQAYDRTGGAYKPVNLFGSAVNSYVSGNLYFAVDLDGSKTLAGKSVYAYRSDNAQYTRLVHDTTGGHIVASAGTLELAATAVNITGSTTSSSATAGDGVALPALPKGYLTIQINGLPFKIAYYEV